MTSNYVHDYNIIVYYINYYIIVVSYDTMFICIIIIMRILNDYVCTLLVLYVIEFADHVLYMHRREPLSIYTSYTCPVHPSIGCGDRVDTILTGTHQSLSCTYVVCTDLLSVTSYNYEVCGV